MHFEHPAQLPGDAPAWHSTFFLNEHCHTYFSPRLIRQGILTIGQLLERPTYFSMLAPTWEPIYRHRLQVDQPLLPASLLPTFALPPQPPPDLTFWYAWTRAPVMELLSQPYSLKPRQPDSVWDAFHRCNLPPRHKDFIHKALWARLPVGQRQQSWKPLEVWCPIDQELETVAHTLYHCQFVQKSFAFINQVREVGRGGGRERQTEGGREGERDRERQRGNVSAPGIFLDPCPSSGLLGGALRGRT